MAAAAAIPAEVSTRPLLGILGVVTGAGLVTLAGRMLSLGLADLRGHVGIGYRRRRLARHCLQCRADVYRPVHCLSRRSDGAAASLVICRRTFHCASIFFPFTIVTACWLLALIVAGLTSGTFYPLTLTFALRNIPLRYLPFTLALYATFVDGAVNIAPSLYGWYRDHLSWNWMFWNSALITPVMMICIYFGIPPARRQEIRGRTELRRVFVCLVAGLALFFAAFEQGERLDWWRSGVFNALFWSGSFSSCCVRWFGDYAVPIRWWRYLIC